MKNQRWRITFSKTAAMRYTGHLDLILTWERTFRRSGLPLAYSEGFSPRPVIVLAAPLPLGYISRGEIGDFWLSETVSRIEFERSLRKALPPGLEIRLVEEVHELHGDKLPNLVQAAGYAVTLPTEMPSLPERINRLLAQKQLICERKGKTYDLRPLILDLAMESHSGPEESILHMTLSLLPGATGRPDEVLKALEVPVSQTLIVREEILLRDPSQER